MNLLVAENGFWQLLLGDYLLGIFVYRKTDWLLTIFLQMQETALETLCLNLSLQVFVDAEYCSFVFVFGQECMS